MSFSHTDQVPEENWKGQVGENWMKKRLSSMDDDILMRQFKADAFQNTDQVIFKYAAARHSTRMF